LGEISPDEFAGFIGPDIRIEPVILSQESNIEKLLNYYMGKNTPERQEFIIDNLVVEKDNEPEMVKTVLEPEAALAAD
jgi:topoisomerase-4 subunit B